MSTSVFLSVTPAAPVDSDRWVNEIPADLAAALKAAGQSASAALERSGSGPWRWRFQLSGPDRVPIGQQLCARVRGLGYEADSSFWP